MKYRIREREREREMFLINRLPFVFFFCKKFTLLLFLGYKGVLSLNDSWFKTNDSYPNPPGVLDRSKILVVFRKSMKKFPSDDNSFEIADFSKFAPYFLNRQVC